MTDRLYAAAQRALSALDDLMRYHDDPGAECFGARYELAQALIPAAGVRDAARHAAGQPAADEPQDHPAAELYVLLRKAGEDRDTAQQLIYAHAAMAIRQHTAINGDTSPAVEQPAEAQPAEAHESARIRIINHPGVLATADTQIAALLDEYRAEILREAAETGRRLSRDGYSAQEIANHLDRMAVEETR
ncbi:hypothetical protein [Streptomyces sp. NPDC054975]